MHNYETSIFFLRKKKSCVILRIKLHTILVVHDKIQNLCFNSFFKSLMCVLIDEDKEPTNISDFWIILAWLNYKG